MGFMDKIKGIVNPESVEDAYDDEYVYEDNEPESEDDYQIPPQVNANSHQQPQQPQSQTQGQMQQQPNTGGIMLNSSSLELKVIKPESFDSVTQIADHLLNKRTVVLNLEATNKETAKRLIGFLSGVAYAIDGQIQRVANNTFVITPCNVEISGEQLREESQHQQNRNQSSNMYNNY